MRLNHWAINSRKKAFGFEPYNIIKETERLLDSMGQKNMLDYF